MRAASIARHKMMKMLNQRGRRMAGLKWRGACLKEVGSAL